MSALIKDPNGFLKIADKATIEQCIESVPAILGMIEHAAKSPILGAGLLVVSGYLLYESHQLYKRTASLEQNLEKYNNDFKLLQVELDIINDFVNKDVEPHWKNGDTAKLVRNLKTVMIKLTSFFNRLNELADYADKDIKQISDDRTRSFGYLVVAMIMGFTIVYFLIQAPIVFVPMGILCVFIQFHNCACIGSLDKTRKEIELLKAAITKKRAEIDKVRAFLKSLR